MVALKALTLALALTPAAIAPTLAIPRRQASNLCGDSVVESVGPDPSNVPRRTILTTHPKLTNDLAVLIAVS